MNTSAILLNKDVEGAGELTSTDSLAGKLPTEEAGEMSPKTSPTEVDTLLKNLEAPSRGFPRFTFKSDGETCTFFPITPSILPAFSQSSMPRLEPSRGIIASG